MAAIYSPWSNAGAEYEIDDNMATGKYAEGYDAVEDANEGETPATEEEGMGKPEDAGEGDMGKHAEIMKEALSIMSEQQRVIRGLTDQLAGKKPA